MNHLNRVIIYGSQGALGTKLTSCFKNSNFYVISIAYNENALADYNVTVNRNDSMQQQGIFISNSLKSALGDNKVDGIICVAGGWSGGNAKNNLLKISEEMWHQSVSPSLLSASIASQYLKEEGLLVLPGAKIALDPTPNMIGYGISKAAVHHLAKSLAEKGSGLPNQSVTVAILPTVLDTPQNRKAMPNGDFSSWTSLEYVADTLLEWVKGKDRPKNGSLVELLTTNFRTSMKAI